MTWDQIRGAHTWLPLTSDGWHQHEHGGGWVRDTASVSPAAWVGAGGVVYGGAVYSGAVYGGAVYGGEMYGGAMYGGAMYGGAMRGGAMYGGAMYGGAMYGGAMRGGEMYGGAMHGGATLCDGMVIREPRDMLVIGPIGTRNAYLTMTRTHAATGCFGGTWDELRSRLTDENRADYERVLRFAAEHFEKEATR